MKIDNVRSMEKIFTELKDKKTKFRVIDERWKKRGDIDIIINKDSYGTFDKILRANGFELKSKIPPWAPFYRKFQKGEFIMIGAHIGGYIGGFGGGLGKTLGKKFNPEKTGGTYLKPEEQIFIMIYKALTKPEVTWKYEEYYEKLRKEKINKKRLKELLNKAFNNADQIAIDIERGKQLKEIKAELRITKDKKSQLTKKARGKIMEAAKTIYRIFKPRPYIAIIGTDGSGKTTTTKNLTKILEENKLKVKTFYGGRFYFQMLPINLMKPGKVMKKMMDKAAKKEKGTKKQKDMFKEYKSPMIKTITPILYYLEYLLRYILKVYPARIKNDIVITDRAFIDILVSPNTNKVVGKILLDLMPMPKLIWIWNDPDTIYKRRPDHPKEDIKRQFELYKKMIGHYFYVIRSEGKKEVTEKILEKIQKLI